MRGLTHPVESSDVHICRLIWVEPQCRLHVGSATKNVAIFNFFFYAISVVRVPPHGECYLELAPEYTNILSFTHRQ
jgi:hypothetical protein